MIANRAKKKDDRIDIHVRIETVWAVGEWYADELVRNPALKEKFRPDSHRFLSGLLTRKSSPMKVRAGLAKRFAEAWRQVFISSDRPELLLSIADHADRSPVVGIEALAELVADIRFALTATKGRPKKLDPVEVVERLAEKAAIRKRGERTEQSVELLAEELGVSTGTVESARKKGRSTIANVRKVLNDTCQVVGNVDPLFFLTDDGKSGVMVVRKK